MRRLSRQTDACRSADGRSRRHTARGDGVVERCRRRALAHPADGFVLASVGAQLRAAAQRWNGLQIIDASSHFSGHPEWIAGDGIHLTRTGQRELATFIRDAVAAALRRKAERTAPGPESEGALDQPVCPACQVGNDVGRRVS